MPLNHDLVSRCYEEAIYALAAGVDYDDLTFHMVDYASYDFFEEAIGIQKALEAWSGNSEPFNCRISDRYQVNMNGLYEYDKEDRLYEDEDDYEDED